MKENSEWWKRMLAKYGTEEAVRDVMRANAAKSSRNSAGTGGFAKLKNENPERLKEISRLGVESRNRGTREV